MNSFILVHLKQRYMKVTVCVEKQAGVRNCSCFVEEDLGKYGLAGYGSTVDEAVADLLVSRKEFIEDGYDVPELEMTFKYDLWAFFDKFPMNASLVAKEIGINASLMRQYIAGQKQPSKMRVKQIEDGIREIGRKLSEVTLVRF